MLETTEYRKYNLLDKLLHSNYQIGSYVEICLRSILPIFHFKILSPQIMTMFYQFTCKHPKLHQMQYGTVI